MEMKEWIIIGGGALIGLVALYGFLISWWRGRDPLRMKIQPGLLPEDADEDAWQSAELPNGGARVVGSVDSADRRLNDPDPAEEGVPVLLDPVAPPSVAEADGGSDPTCAAQVQESLESDKPLADMAPIVPERGIPAAHEDAPRRSTQVEAMEAAGDGGLEDIDPEADGRSFGQPASADAGLGAMAASPVPFEESGGAEGEGAQSEPDAADNLLVIQLLAPEDETFSGGQLIAAMRAQDLQFGQMGIFHRLDAASGEVAFSVASAVEPGSFDLERIEDCASPGLVAFLQLPSRVDAEEALDDMMRTAQAMADDLGGKLLDKDRQPFTALSAESYRNRALGFAARQMPHGAR